MTSLLGFLHIAVFPCQWIWWIQFQCAQFRVLIGRSSMISIHEQLIMADSSYICNMTHFNKHQWTVKPKHKYKLYAAAVAGIAVTVVATQYLLHHRAQQQQIRHMASFFRYIVYFRIIARLFCILLLCQRTELSICAMCLLCIYAGNEGKVGFQLLSFSLSVFSRMTSCTTITLHSSSCKL